MDFLTIIGLALGIGATYFVMWDGGIARFIYDRNSLILVLGGTLAATLISFPWRDMKEVPRAIKFMFFPPKHSEIDELIGTIVEISLKSKMSGLESLFADLPDMNEKFLSKGLGLLLEGADPGAIDDLLRKEIILMQQRHQKVASIFKAMGTYAPVFGLLGTLIGVLQVLGILNDPKQSIQEGMSVAITTTFYGIFGANFIFLPAAVKLSGHSDREMLNMELILEGIQCIAKGEAPSSVRSRLGAFVSNRLREKTGEK